MRDLLDLLLPAVCARCGAGVAAADVLCPPCDAALPRLPVGVCVLCQAAPPGDAGHCTACGRAGWPFQACSAALPFQGEAASWLRRFKYPAPGLWRLDAAAEAVVCAWIGEAAERAALLRPELVLPIPMHPSRLRRRGFDPAGVLARSLARSRGLPLATRLLERLRDTPSQTGLDREARRRNLRGAFGLRASLGARRLWLVDDVVTTGATVAEAARLLRRAGAREIQVVAAARTPARV